MSQPAVSCVRHTLDMLLVLFLISQKSIPIFRNPCHDIYTRMDQMEKLKRTTSSKYYVASKKVVTTCDSDELDHD